MFVITNDVIFECIIIKSMQIVEVNDDIHIIITELIMMTYQTVLSFLLAPQGLSHNLQDQPFCKSTIQFTFSFRWYWCLNGISAVFWSILTGKVQHRLGQMRARLSMSYILYIPIQSTNNFPCIHSFTLTH